MNRRNRHRVLNGLRPQKVASKPKENLSVEATIAKVLDEYNLVYFNKNDDLFPNPEHPLNRGLVSEWSCYHGHIANIAISTELNREQLFELGRRVDYYRFVSFPLKITEEVYSDGEYKIWDNRIPNC